MFMHIFQADPSYDLLHTGWHLASVSVLNPGTGKRHTFSHNAWLLGPDALTVHIKDTTGGKQEQDPLPDPRAAAAAAAPAAAPAAPSPPKPRDAFDDDETSSRLGGTDLFDEYSIRSGNVIDP